jgi:hypothetical protein
LYEAAQNFEFFLNIQNLNQKIKNLYQLMSFQGLSNGTTLMQIQSGRTVPLKGLSHEIDFKNFEKKLHNLA